MEPSQSDRIHFGSIEAEERRRNQTRMTVDQEDASGVNLEDLSEETHYELSGSSQVAQEEQRAVVEEFERRARARQLAVPTDDGRVRARLRELGEPQCLFAEGPGDRRDRLRYILSQREGAGEAEDEEMESVKSEDEEAEEEFFTPGSQELLEARQWIAKYSIPRAKARIMQYKAEQDTPIPVLRKSRKELHDRIKNYTNWSSQLADDRPLAQCAFSPDSSMVITGAWSGLCKLWSVPNSECIKTLRGHVDRIGGVVFHPQSTISQDKGSLNIATGGADSNIHLWNLESETPMATMSGHAGRIARIDFHPSGRFVGSASFDGTWRLWDVDTTQELLMQEGHSREVYAISFQGDGSLVASGGLDSIGRVWDMRTGRSSMTLQGHVKDILALSWSPNGFQLASGSADNTVRIWDMRNLRSIYTIAAHRSLVSDVKFYRGQPPVSGAMDMDAINHAGQYLVTGGYDGSVKIWAADDYKLIKSLEGHEGKVMGVDVSNDGKYIVSSGYDRTFKFWADENMTI
ncbi:WD40-repeat-containing domain protein [Umbelopsis sp. PMI_123]|nr:WD40-repeat-containing domain protein [Umbelopsis sp. PMI_123]